MSAVTVENISKNYRIYPGPSARLKELIFPSRKFHQDFWALRNVSFSVKKGSTFAIIGENGSGKSTLLQIIAGTLTATRGKVELNGRLAALLELGAGFNPEFTGRENTFLNGAILGLTRKDILQRLPEIERFAEIGEFLDQPVKTYSSGMYVRLAFAISINVDPEILLVDESLSVGDIYFQQRCMHKIRQMKQEGKTILFVSHDLAAVKNLCESAVWLDNGVIREQGSAAEVAARYLAAITLKKDPYRTIKSSNVSKAFANIEKEQPVDLTVREIPNVDERWGNGNAKILGIKLLDEEGKIPQNLYHGDSVTTRISVEFKQAVMKPIIGIIVRNRLGEEISGVNTSLQNVELPPSTANQIYTVDFHICLPVLQPGNYYLTPAIADGTYLDFVVCDLVENALSMTLQQRETVYGYMKMTCQIEIKQVRLEPTKSVDS